MSIYDLTAYEVVQTADLSDLKSKGILLRHKKSGARVLLMENDDENKVFYYRLPYPAVRQHGRAPYHGAFGTVRFQRVPGEGSLCGAGERLPEYISECHDISGQDGVPRCQLQ